MAMGSRIDHSAVGYMKAKFSIMSGIDIGPPMPPYQAASESEIQKARSGIEKIKKILARDGLSL